MSTIAQITRLTEAKTNIKTALNNKGLTISDSDKIDSYADYIEAMPTIYKSTITPTSSTGKNGDIWLVKSS